MSILIPQDGSGPLDLSSVINHPFRAKSGYKNFHGDPKELSYSPTILKEGDVGRIHDYQYNGNTGVHKFRIENPNQPQELRKGWVLGRVLEINQAKTWDDVETVLEGNVFPLVQQPSTAAVPSTSNQSDILGASVTAWLHEVEMEKNHLLLGMVPFAWKKTVGERGQLIDEVASQILQGVETAGLRQVLSKKDFTWRDIVNAGKSVDSSSVEKGIYLRIYGDIADTCSVNVDPATYFDYVGVTGMTFWARHQSHAHSANNPASPSYDSKHYEIFRHAAEFHMVPLCAFDDSSFSAEIAMIAEQLFICLFQSYRTDIFGLNFGERMPDVVATGTEFFIAPDIMNSWRSRFLSTSYPLSVVTNAALAKMPEESRWPGASQRASFGCSSGLNLKSPMGERGVNQKPLWIMSKGTDEDLGGVTLYRKALGVNSSKKFNVSVYGSLRGKKVKTNFRSKLDIGPGSQPQLVVECLDSGLRHPRAWAGPGMPTVGCFDDWDLATSFAARFEWEDADGNTNYQYLYRKRSRELLAKADHPSDPGAGSLRSYAVGIAMWRYLNRLSCSTPHEWEIDLGIATVRQVTTDTFNRLVIFSRVLGRMGTAPSNNARSEINIMTDLRAAGLENVGAGFRKFSGPKDNRRSHCDGCVKVIDFTEKSVCVRIEGSDDCKSCRLLYRRPCSWTRSALLKPGAPGFEARKAALSGPDYHESRTKREKLHCDMRIWEAYECNELGLDEDVEEEDLFGDDESSGDESELD